MSADDNLPDGIQRDLPYLQELASRLNCRVILPTALDLLIDIDRPYDEWFSDNGHARFLERLDRLVVNNLLAFEGWHTWTSSGGNTHIQVRMMRPQDGRARIAYQLMLGSDPVREMLSYTRIQNGVAHPIALFQPLTVLPPDWEERPDFFDI